MTRASMMTVSAATAGILIACTAAAISVVNATQTTPTSNSINLIPTHSPASAVSVDASAPASTVPVPRAPASRAPSSTAPSKPIPSIPHTSPAAPAEPGAGAVRPDDHDGDDD